MDMIHFFYLFKSITSRLLHIINITSPASTMGLDKAVAKAILMIVRLYFQGYRPNPDSPCVT